MRCTKMEETWRETLRIKGGWVGGGGGPRTSVLFLERAVPALLDEPLLGCLDRGQNPGLRVCVCMLCVDK